MANLRYWKVSKNTLNKIRLVLFPIEDLILEVETAKRILTKEKIDRQLAGQSSLTPFMGTVVKGLQLICRII